jgi:lipoate synthase
MAILTFNIPNNLNARQVAYNALRGAAWWGASNAVRTAKHAAYTAGMFVPQEILSLEVIKQMANSGLVAKSGIMVGLGETNDEVLQTMDDLLAVGCSVMTIGQYLQPTKRHLPVAEYVYPEQFEKWKEAGLRKGFRFVESYPLVRSSYRAERHVIKDKTV